MLHEDSGTKAHADCSVGTRILRRRQVEFAVGLARSTIYEAMAEGRFPKPVRLGGRSVGWLSTEIESWIAARIAESRPTPGIKAPIDGGALKQAAG